MAVAEKPSEDTKDQSSKSSKESATTSKLKLRPLGSRVVIKALEREEMTKSGIVLPDTVKEKPQEGRVLAVGPGDRHPDTGERIAVELKEGDRVLFQKYAGTEFKLDDEELLILSEKDVLGIVAS
ncbi:MAG: co-chaperone GroES [Candidatus Limnocylindria bacterium]